MKQESGVAESCPEKMRTKQVDWGYTVEIAFTPSDRPSDRRLSDAAQRAKRLMLEQEEGRPASEPSPYAEPSRRRQSRAKTPLRQYLQSPGLTDDSDLDDSHEEDHDSDEEDHNECSENGPHWRSILFPHRKDLGGC